MRASISHWWRGEKDPLSMATNFSQVRSIFLAALEKPAEAREAHLAQACGDDAGLRQQVDLLLDAHEKHGILDDATQAQAVATNSLNAERPGEVISGRYKL